MMKRANRDTNHRQGCRDPRKKRDGLLRVDIYTSFLFVLPTLYCQLSRLRITCPIFDSERDNPTNSVALWLDLVVLEGKPVVTSIIWLRRVADYAISFVLTVTPTMFT